MVPDAVIGLFVHTPFPSSEVYRCLPSMLLILFIYGYGVDDHLFRAQRDFGWHAWCKPHLLPGERSRSYIIYAA